MNGADPAQTFGPTDPLHQQIVEHSPDCIKIVDRDLRLRWMNESGRRLMEVCEAELVGSAWLDFWTGETRAIAAAAVASALDSGVGRFTGPCATARGTLKWWNVVVTRFHRDDACLLIISRDVTDIVGMAEAQKAIAEAERVARDQAELANRRIEAVLHTVWHDLRAPLNAVVGWATIIAAEAAPGSIREAAATIQSAAGQQMRILAQLLDRIREDSTPPPPDTPVSLTGIVAESVAFMQPALDAKHLDVRTSRPDADLLVEGDTDGLMRAVLNLLDNALKFTPAGGSLRVDVGRDGGAARLVLADSGCGMTPDAIPRVFDRFWKGAPPGASTSPGLGLGLFIAKSIVERHNGSIEAASDGPGMGARFTVRLPLADAGLAEERNACAADAIPPADAAATDLSGVPVLLVHRNQTARRVLAEALVHFGATVATAEDVESAAASLRDAPPSVMVVDDGLPGDAVPTLLDAARGPRGMTATLVLVGADASSCPWPQTCERIAAPVTPRAMAARIRQLADAGART